MKGSALEKNRKYSEKFIQPLEESKVPIYIVDIIKEKHIKSIIDLGCGDGGFVSSIKKEFPNINIVGVDISPRRINGLKERFPRGEFCCGDVCNTKIKKKFELIYSSQVLEHVEGDKAMIKEMGRMLRDNGNLFVSSVIKKPYFIYKYRNNGKFVLDPTHEREYKTQKEFLDLFKNDFKLIKSWIEPVRRKLFGLNIKIPGFYLVYGIWKKRR